MRMTALTSIHPTATPKPNRTAKMKRTNTPLKASIAALKKELEVLREQFTACMQMNEILMMMLMPDEFIEKQSHPEYAPIPSDAFYDPGYSPSRLP